MAGTQLQSALDLARQLKTEWAKASPDLQKCGQLLKQLKIALTHLSFLPVNEKPTQEEVLLARDVLEIGALWSIKTEDVPSFERYMAQLKNYYFDLAWSTLPESEHRSELLGLNLLRLLAQNHIPDFHTELELLPTSSLSHPHIAYPMKLEQYLIEGSYNKILHARAGCPAESYLFFINILSDTVREEIGVCCEKAYDNIPVSELRKILFLEKDEDAMKIAQKRGWKMSGGAFQFTAPPKATNEIPAAKLIAQTMSYARELEKIV
eukprot:comp25645_c0_seq1/m.47016 comp25645_c0_seq1/g.47016  ORF comp25645_c0_seq1/g.47016 comp25645_c0_seq1/m.47016 type:complete len:265 (-) comp25645_c0_seq1:26-820(-)